MPVLSQHTYRHTDLHVGRVGFFSYLQSHPPPKGCCCCIELPESSSFCFFTWWHNEAHLHNACLVASLAHIAQNEQLSCTPTFWAVTADLALWVGALKETTTKSDDFAQEALEQCTVWEKHVFRIRRAWKHQASCPAAFHSVHMVRELRKTEMLTHKCSIGWVWLVFVSTEEVLLTWTSSELLSCRIFTQEKTGLMCHLLPICFSEFYCFSIRLLFG